MADASKRTASEEAERDAKRSKTDSEGAQGRKLRIAVVCSSNQNRSMEAHRFLAKEGFTVQSFGSGQHVKIPGESIDKPNKWEFGKDTYDEMFKQLESANKDLYQKNGMLTMLERNRNIKLKPERFQDCKNEFDIIVTCEGRVYDQVLQDLEEREQQSCEPVHVCNVEIKDNHMEAVTGALKIVELCEQLEKVEDLENDIEEALEKFDKKNKQEVLHSVSYY